MIVSVERGEPTTFGVTQVIKGWVEGLQLMTVGSKYKFYIPAELAYGMRGSGPKIGPMETLVFEVELLGIEKIKLHLVICNMIIIICAYCKL